MNMETFDAIVIGAGAMGSAVAYHLTKANQRVLLLEQFDLDHQKGSSYGHSRIIRYSYDHSTYIALAKATYPAWMALQAEAGEQLYRQTGGIDFGPPEATTLMDTIDCLQRAHIDCELLTSAVARSRFPQLRFDRDMQILYQPDTGVSGSIKVRPDSCASGDAAWGKGSGSISCQKHCDLWRWCGG